MREKKSYTVNYEYEINKLFHEIQKCHGDQSKICKKAKRIRQLVKISSLRYRKRILENDLSRYYANQCDQKDRIVEKRKIDATNKLWKIRQEIQCLKIGHENQKKLENYLTGRAYRGII